MLKFSKQWRNLIKLDKDNINASSELAWEPFIWKSLGGIIWLQKPGIVKIDVPMHNYLVH